MPREMVCGACGTPITVLVAVPPQCAKCGAARWRSRSEDPVKPYALSRKDAILLKALRIDPEQGIER